MLAAGFGVMGWHFLCLVGFASVLQLVESIEGILKSVCGDFLDVTVSSVFKAGVGSGFWFNMGCISNDDKLF